MREFKILDMVKDFFPIYAGFLLIQLIMKLSEIPVETDKYYYAVIGVILSAISLIRASYLVLTENKDENK